MKEDKRRLTVVNANSVVPETTCFAAHETYNVDCNRRTCPQWIVNGESHNCVIIAARSGPHTLQKIGTIFGLTRMRICQIEKDIFEKIRQAS